MRVLLVPPKSNYPYPNPNAEHVSQGFPYIAAALKKSGHEVFGLNLNNIYCDKRTLRVRIKEALERYAPDFVGVGGLSGEYLFVRDAMEAIRYCNPTIPIVLGGGIVTSDSDYIVKDLKPDYGVLSEGEETILEIVQLKNKKDISGLVYFDEELGEPAYTGRRKAIMDLDLLPFPEYDVFDIEAYIEATNNYDNYFHARTRTNPRILPLSGARSCPFKCTFCWHSGPYRKRSIDNVMEEIVYMHEKYRFNILKVYDEMLGLDRVREFSLRMKDLKHDIDWSCSMRVPNIDIDTLKIMKDAGCIHIGYGFESASQIVLDSMKKKTTVEQIRKAIEMTEKVGIGVQANFIYGDPAETPETMKETRAFFDKYCRNHIVHQFYIYPFPGSEVFEHCLEKGVIKDRRKFYETIHTFPIYNMTEMDTKTFLDILKPILVDNEFELSPISVEPHGSNNRIKSNCPHCKQDVEYVFPIRFDVIHAKTRISVICSKCHKRFNISIKSLMVPTMKHLLKKGKFIAFMRTLRLYIKCFASTSS